MFNASVVHFEPEYATMHEAAAEPISLRPLVTSPDDDPLAAILHQGDELLLAQAIEAEVPGVDRSSAA